MRSSPGPVLRDAPETEDLARGAWIGMASNPGKPLPVSHWHLKCINSVLAPFHAFAQEPAEATASGRTNSRAVTYRKSTWFILWKVRTRP